ncbi:uncharacterized protein [Halyomorpha halys]|uniref:uncharacterized protein n=1 Tax=Halyomorpha halys TaxID=286706 RepID=UPI0006D4C701
MWTVILLSLAIVELVVGDVYYTKTPVYEYYPAEKVKFYAHPEVPVVPVHPQYLYKHAPEYYHSDGKMAAEEYYGNDGLKKSVHDVQQSALKAVHGEGGDHKVYVDTAGKHGYEHGEAARKTADEGVVASGKTKEYDTALTNGYGEQEHGGFKKSHKNTGFHRSYHKEESGKDHQYEDVDHKVGEENFGKAYGDLYGEAGREGHAQANGEAGYKYLTSGRAGEGSGLRSAAVHDSNYGHHGREDYSRDREVALRNGLAGAYRRGQHGHAFARYEPFY